MLDWFATHFDWFSDPSAWVALGTLTALEIVLGIDNVVFISILAARLPVAQQARARSIGLGLAMFGRIALLLAIGWVMSLTATLFSLPFGAAEVAGVTGRDLILILGGAFLIYKSTHEIHNKLEGDDGHAEAGGKAATFGSVIFQILLLDLVFSLDSVITAVGMADEVGVMILAVVIAIGIMMVSAGAISTFIQKHPTVKMLALSFLLMIGFVLVAEGFGQHISKGYIYGAMAFSLFVETLNLRAKRKAGPPVELRGPGPGVGSGIPAPGFPNA
ncbi:MAG TPA: TerC family protein [Rubricoccaceae bacterium]|jgi:predicted tellurium resistance membrane protein TerC